MRRDDKMVIGVFYNPTGHHVASWRHPEAQADAGINFAHHVEMTHAAEAAKLHFVFFADALCVREALPAALSRSAQYIANFEPLTLLSALAAVSSNIGLVSTASTSFNEPYHVARKFASLDFISGGRAGWNIVTSGQNAEARNFGLEEHLQHTFRYERAHEFVTVVKQLWDSWADDAFIRDKASGIFFDPDKVRALHHQGRFFKVDGPLNIPRPPQGYPVLVQAGQSDTGRDFAAEFAEVIFTAQPSMERSKAFYDDIKARAASFGRDPRHLKVLPGFSTLVGETDAHAEERFEELQSKVDPVVAREILSTQLGGFDLSPYPFDGPMPPLPETNAFKGALTEMRRMAETEQLTIRQLAMRVAAARGKSLIRGSPTTIADIAETWFKEGACDGLILMPTHLPGGLNDFLIHVLPELKRRGLFREDYSGKTLRENLGLPRPARQEAATAEAVAKTS